MDNIKNKTVLITGAARGLGYVYAEEMLRHGAKCVAILDLSSSNGETSAATLEKEYGKGKAIFLPCDVSNAAELTECFKKVVEKFKVLDIVINNAGMLNEWEIERTINVNVMGVIRGTLLAMDHMGKHKGGKGGTIVNVASIAGLYPYRVIPIYGASKFAVIGFSRSMQTHYEKTGVRVLVMCPGVTLTPLVAELKDDKSLDFIDKDAMSNDLKKLPTQSVEHVAKAMVDLIQKGKSDSVWVTEEGKPPYHVDLLHYSKLAVPV